MNSTFGANNNQLQMLSGSSAGGYLLGNGTWTFKYSNADRLAAVLSGSTVVATYRVNAQGQRISKNVGGAIVFFFYDEQGRILGEYDGTGRLIEETIWLEDLPVATLRPTGAGGIPTPINIYYVHADHLGGARAVTRPSDNKLMWQWDNLDPFGANLPNESPAGQVPFRYNLRFPGQYYDAETGTHYNYFRDYDPTIGRYEQSDPIGLNGGLNTYAYVKASPVRWSDARGLIIKICTRAATGMPGNHRYLWDSRTGQTCGMEQFSGVGGDPFKGEKGPNGGDYCTEVADSDGVESLIMRCCETKNKTGWWFPFVNDCFTVSKDCVQRYAPGYVPDDIGRLSNSCSSCWKGNNAPDLPPLY